MQIIKSGGNFTPENEIKLISTDMDGTLLDEEKNYHPDFFDTMTKLQKKGIAFVASSGRSYSKQKDVFSPAEIPPYFICDNGAILIHNDEIIFSHFIEEELVHKIIDVATSISGATPIFCGINCAWHNATDDETKKSLSSYFTTEKIVENLHVIDEPILKVAMFHPESSAKFLFPTMNKAFDGIANLVVSGPFWMDVMALGVNKGEALMALQERLSISYDETMVFGDYYNDIEMLGRGKYSFVMENANDDMKKHGNFEAPSNEEYGVEQILKQLI